MRMFKHQAKDVESVVEAPAGVEAIDDPGTLVLEAELPGIDPDKDVEVTVSDGMLHIEAERDEEKTTDDDGFVRHEHRHWSFARTMPLPAGVSESDIKATYKEGLLQIRMPSGEPEPASPPTKIAITKG